jgi:hypothetical protein
MLQRPPHDPAHYWRLASEMLEAEQWSRLRTMKDAEGLQALIRLTTGARHRRDQNITPDSELLLLSDLFRRAYAHRNGSPT